MSSQATNREPDDDIRASLLRVENYHLGSDSDVSAAKVKVVNAMKGMIHFKQGEAETIRHVLERIDVIALKRTAEGFNSNNFSAGVLNCFMISYVFGAYPQHLWLLYLVEVVYMIPRKFYTMCCAKPLSQALYYLDFCWCVNFSGIALLLVLAAARSGGFEITDDMRALVFSTTVGISCGVLLGANLALPFVACLFHDVNTMTGLFIHLMPPFVMYTFMWQSDVIRAAWPMMFHLNYMEGMHYFPKSGYFDGVAGNAIVFYMLWWFLYVCFILLGGINLPEKFKKDGTPKKPKYDTVFHSTMRDGACIPIGKIFRGRSKKISLKLMEENRFDLVDFFIYMFFHMVAGIGSICTWGYLCFSSQRGHSFMLVVVTTLAVTRGAGRYTYYTTKMYSKTLRKEFASILDDTKQS